MERQRTGASHNHLLSPRSLILLSFASSALLFSLRFGRPFHLPFAGPIGANNSSFIAQAPFLGGVTSGADVEIEEEAFLAGGSGGLGDSAVEGAHRAPAVSFPVGNGSAVEVEEAVFRGGNGETAGNGAVLGTANSVEAKNLSREDFGSTMATRLSLGNASASQEAAASVEKLEGAKSGQAFNLSMEDSGPAMRRQEEFFSSGRVGGSGGSPIQGAHALQQGEQWRSSEKSAVKNNRIAAPSNRTKQDTEKIQEAVVSKMDLTRSNVARCNVYDGRWLFDESYPLYKSNSCSFVDEGFSCEANGRMDQNYTKWRWQPTHCNIPRFGARKMLEMLRGKRLVFVGDSLNRNQWESLMCMLREAVPDPARIHEVRGRRITKERGDYNFKFLDYNCSVEYHVTHFLVHEGKARIGRKRTRTLRIDTIDRSSSRWRGANVLVFNTAHWWSHHKTKAGVNYYQEGDTVHPHLDVSSAYQRALTTWASWVDQYINPRKTHVFFRSSAPSHFSGGEWNSGGHCRESTMPLNDTRARPLPERNAMLEQVVKQMNTRVTILNITNLSGARIDGHPSVYGRKAEDLTTSSSQDCSHWCLPGVPDTWNELLFYHLVSSQENDVTS